MPDQIKVLIVEDNFVNALILQKLLEKDFQVFSAKNSDEALELAKKITFDVVLMDINLGKDSLNGLEVMQTMKAMPQHRHSKFFTVTSYALPEDRERFLKAGFDEYFPKPIEKKTLIRAIKASKLTTNV